MPPRRAARPNATLLCRRLAADMARKLSELSHIQPARILFVAGEARRGSRATIKPLASTRVLLKGKRALYCITLRPKFFRASTPEQRVETLLHELLHISNEFDGRLHPDRRHSLLPGRKFRALLRPLVKRYLAQADGELISALAHHGDVVARQWLQRPKGKASRKQADSGKHLFLRPGPRMTRR